MASPKKKIYIGCGLTNLPEDTKENFLIMIHDIKIELAKYFEVLDFLGIDDIGTDHPYTPEEIYHFDIHKCLMMTDYFLAICDYPATGLGYELGTAVEKREIPVLAVARVGAKVSRSIVGIKHPNFEFFYYNNTEEIVKKTLEKFPQ